MNRHEEPSSPLAVQRRYRSAPPMMTERIMSTIQRIDGKRSIRAERNEARGWVRTVRAIWMMGGVRRVTIKNSISRRYSPIKNMLKRLPNRKKVKANIDIASIISHCALST